MDSGAFAKKILDYLEEKDLRYIVACKFTCPIKRELVRGRIWTEVADGVEISETTYRAQSWDSPRRIVMVRQEVGKRPLAAGKQVRQLYLFEDQTEYGKYRYSCFVTILALPAKVVYDTYRGRADSKNRIKELKAHFAMDSFVTHNFWASEACGSFIVLAYNFFSLFRHALINSPKKSFLKTTRYEFIATPAHFSKSKDKHILYLARSLKTRSAFQGIWDSFDYFTLPYNV